MLCRRKTGLVQFDQATGALHKMMFVVKQRDGVGDCLRPFRHTELSSSPKHYRTVPQVASNPQRRRQAMPEYRYLVN